MGAYNQELFLGISFIIIIIIMIIIKDKTQAMLFVGLVANFLLISTQLVLINNRRTLDKMEDPAKLNLSNKKNTFQIYCPCS
jgi:hypothetical protein